jgi:hypothetical protein
MNTINNNILLILIVFTYNTFIQNRTHLHINSTHNFLLLLLHYTHYIYNKKLKIHIQRNKTYLNIKYLKLYINHCLTTSVTHSTRFSIQTIFMEFNSETVLTYIFTNG